MSKENSFKFYILVFFISLLAAFSLRFTLSYYLVGKYIVGTENWIAIAQRHKKNKAKSISEKKILIVSGSNALFGISAEKISQDLGVPTVNLATHAGLGVKYILDDAKTVIKPGDTVLLPLEYNSYLDDGQLTKLYLKHVLSNDRDYFNNINAAQKINHLFRLSNADIIESLLNQKNKGKVILGLQKRALQGKCYSGFYLNNFGDELCNVGKQPHSNIPNQVDIPEMYEIDEQKIISNFINWCKEHNVRILALYPVMLDRQEFREPRYQQFFNEINKFYQEQQVLLLGDPYQASLPPHLMYNTHYHPTDSGRMVRTEEIISLIQPYFQTVNP